jgi:hypothetical protein
MLTAFAALSKTVLSPTNGYDHTVINQAHFAIDEMLDRITLIE